MTFDVAAQLFIGQAHGWQNWHEVFSICRHCQQSTIFVIAMNVGQPQEVLDVFKDHSNVVTHRESLQPSFKVEKYISLKDRASVPPPEHVPEAVAAAFKEGAACLSIGCYNAAGTMFRLCLDLATRPLLPDPQAGGPQPNSRQRRDIGLRIPWLLDNELLPEALRGLSTAVREDGNDGAHAGTLTKEDAEDLLDFTIRLLQRLFTEPKELELAAERRAKRRS
jgi:hypothetical protein